MRVVALKRTSTQARAFAAGGRLATAGLLLIASGCIVEPVKCDMQMVPEDRDLFLMLEP